ASGLAAIALYKARAAEPQGEIDRFASRAVSVTGGVFLPIGDPAGGSICYYRAGDPLCLSDPAAPGVRVIGADHGQENPPYGVGILTSLSAACSALADAGATSRCVFDAPRKAILQGLFLHGQQKSAVDGSAFLANACVNFSTGGMADCGDPAFGYLPT